LSFGIGGASFPLAEGFVPKPKRDHTRKEVYEVGIEDRSQVSDGDAIFRNHYPVDRQKLDDDQFK